MPDGKYCSDVLSRINVGQNGLGFLVAVIAFD
jgi:hypothetical protein